MREILDGYNEIFLKWTNQKKKIIDLEAEIVCMESDLKAEERSNTALMEAEIEKAETEFKDAEALLKKVEKDELREATGQQLKEAENTLQSCKEFYDFVTDAFGEQQKLWELVYQGWRQRIENVRERLTVERAILNFYAAELEEWKTKIHSKVKQVL